MAPLLTRADVCKLCNISKTTLDRWIQRGKFPPADVRLGYRCPRWKWETIRKFLGWDEPGFC